MVLTARGVVLAVSVLSSIGSPNGPVAALAPVGPKRAKVLARDRVPCAPKRAEKAVPSAGLKLARKDALSVVRKLDPSVVPRHGPSVALTRGPRNERKVARIGCVGWRALAASVEIFADSVLRAARPAWVIAADVPRSVAPALVAASVSVDLRGVALADAALVNEVLEIADPVHAARAIVARGNLATVRKPIVKVARNGASVKHAAIADRESEVRVKDAMPSVRNARVDLVDRDLIRTTSRSRTTTR